MEPLSLLSLVPSAMQLGQGLKQGRLLKKLKKSDYIPGATLEKEARARSRANQTQLPGQARLEEKMDSATANTLSASRRNAKDSTTVLEKVQEADAVKKANMADVNARLENFKLRNEQVLNNALSEKARHQRRNQDQYDAAKSALEGAKRQNFYNAATNAASAAIMTDGFKKKPDVPDPTGGNSQLLGNNQFNPQMWWMLQNMRKDLNQVQNNNKVW